MKLRALLCARSRAAVEKQGSDWAGDWTLKAHTLLARERVRKWLSRKGLEMFLCGEKGAKEVRLRGKEERVARERPLDWGGSQERQFARKA